MTGRAWSEPPGRASSPQARPEDPDDLAASAGPPPGAYQYGAFVVPADASAVQRLLCAEDARERARGAAERLAARAGFEEHFDARAAQGDAAPWHSPADCFSSLVEALYRATGAENPGFTIDSDPKVIYLWTLHALNRFERECRAAGRAEAEREVTRPLPLEVAERLMTTCEVLMDALRAAQPSPPTAPSPTPPAMPPGAP